MKTIYKYPLHPQFDRINECAMPSDAQILTMQIQAGIPVVWALVNTESPTKKVRFLTWGTGWDMDDDSGEYVGTFQESGFVWHVFMKEVP